MTKTRTNTRMTTRMTTRMKTRMNMRMITRMKMRTCLRSTSTVRKSRGKKTGNIGEEHTGEEHTGEGEGERDTRKEEGKTGVHLTKQSKKCRKKMKNMAPKQK